MQPTRRHQLKKTLFGVVLYCFLFVCSFAFTVQLTNHWIEHACIDGVNTKLNAFDAFVALFFNAHMDENSFPLNKCDYIRVWMFFFCFLLLFLHWKADLCGVRVRFAATMLLGDLLKAIVCGYALFIWQR